MKVAHFVLFCSVILSVLIHVNSLSIYLDLPKKDGNFIIVGFKGSFNEIQTDHLPPNVTSLTFDTDSILTEKLVSYSLNIWVDLPDNHSEKTIVYSQQDLQPGYRLDLTEPITKTGLEIVDQDIFYFQGQLKYTPSAEPGVSTYSIRVHYTHFGGSDVVLINTRSLPDSPEGRWLDSAPMGPLATFDPKKNEVVFTFKSVPFPVNELQFRAYDYLQFHSLDDEDQIPTCTMNNLETETKKLQSLILLTLLPDEPEAAIPTGHSITIVCTNIMTRQASVGTEYPRVYFEFTDFQNHPAAVFVPSQTVSRKPSFPLLKPSSVLSTISAPKTQGMTVCSLSLHLSDLPNPIESLNKDILSATVQGLPIPPSYGYMTLSAAKAGSSNPSQERLNLYMVDRPLPSDSKSTITSTFQYDLKNWGLADKKQPLMAVFTFIFPESDTISPTESYRPQCVFGYIDTQATQFVEDQRAIIGPLGRPITSKKLAFSNKLLKTVGDNKAAQYSFGFEILELSGGFNRLVVQLPQQDVLITGDFKCKVTSTHYPEDDRTKNPIVEQFDITGVGQNGQIFNPGHIFTSRIVFLHDFQAHFDYLFVCEKTFFQRDLTHSVDNAVNHFQNTLIMVYGFNSQNGELDKNQDYLIGTNSVKFNVQKKGNLFVIICSVLLLIAAALAISLFFYLRSKETKQTQLLEETPDDNYTSF